MPLFVTFLAAIVGACAAFCVWIELLFRDAAVYVVVLFMPLAAAAISPPFGQAMRRAETAQTMELAGEMERRRQGFMTTASDRRRAQAVTRREEELADGFAECASPASSPSRRGTVRSWSGPPARSSTRASWRGWSSSVCTESRRLLSPTPFRFVAGFGDWYSLLERKDHCDDDTDDHRHDEPEKPRVRFMPRRRQTVALGLRSTLRLLGGFLSSHSQALDLTRDPIEDLPLHSSSTESNEKPPRKIEDQFRQVVGHDPATECHRPQFLVAAKAGGVHRGLGSGRQSAEMVCPFVPLAATTPSPLQGGDDERVEIHRTRVRTLPEP